MYTRVYNQYWKRGENLAVTIKQLAKQQHVTQQAIRQRIVRTVGFQKKYTFMHDNLRFIKDSGVNILNKHKQKRHNTFNVHQKHVLEAKIKILTNANNDLRYQLRHSDSNTTIRTLQQENQDLRHEVARWQYESQKNDYYAHTNWFERLFEKPPFKELPIVEPTDTNTNSNNHK